jgi:hypothetical protein
MERIANIRNVQSKMHKKVSNFIKEFCSWGLNNTAIDISVPEIPKIATMNKTIPSMTNL